MEDIGGKGGGTMGISFEIDTEEGIIYAMAEGKIGLEDIQAAQKNVVADPNFSPALVLIIEFRMSSISMSYKETLALADSLPAEPPRKVSIVATGSGRELFVRYKDFVRGKSNVEVFSDMGSAKKWVTSD